jgi:hypothetical protein
MKRPPYPHLRVERGLLAFLRALHREDDAERLIHRRVVVVERAPHHAGGIFVARTSASERPAALQKRKISSL